MKNPYYADSLRIITFLGDMGIFICIQTLVFKLRLQSEFSGQFFNETGFIGTGLSGFLAYFPHFFIGTLLFGILTLLFGLYSNKIYLDLISSSKKINLVCAIWVLGYLLAALFFKVDPSISRSFVFLVGLISVPFLIIWRLLAKQLIYKTTLASKIEDKVLVVGSSKNQSHFLKRLENHPSLGFRVIEHVLLNDHETQNGMDKQKHRSVSTSEIEILVKTGEYDCVLLADNAIGQDKISYLIQLCHRELVQFLFIPMFFEVLISGLQLRIVSGVPLISIGKNPLDRFFNRLIKRIVDVVGALVGLLVFGPVILLFSLLVFRESPGPVFYSQIRAGRSGKKFKMYKIRSMRLDAEKDHGPQWAKENDGRRLVIGGFMRRWNIDELPQFWNVLKGDMSLVGPRPERPVFIREFKHRVGYYNLRHSVKPGVTGWAAINGWRGNTDLDERIRFDLDYIEHWSLWFDFQIMILTFFRNKNAY